MAGIFTRFTLRSLARNRARSAVTIVGIALSTALLAAILTSVASVQNGLLKRTTSFEGSWQVMVAGADESAVEALQNSDEVRRLGVSWELGSAQTPRSQADAIGSFVTVRTMLQTQKDDSSAQGPAAPLTVEPEVTEGRPPQTPGELILPDYCKGLVLDAEGQGGAASDGPLGLGSKLTLDLGVRTGVVDGKSQVLNSVSDPPQPSKPADFSNSSPTAKRSASQQAVVGAKSTGYTVVGFYKRQINVPGNSFTSAISSIVALTAASDKPAGQALLWVDAAGLDSQGNISDLVHRSCPAKAADAALYHTSLFRYQGVSYPGSLHQTIWWIAVILALVIVLASVSLIYNSFSISVAERTRQFGLLAAIGASRRQIRRSVFVEAALLGLVGVPLGIALGVGGTAAVFSASRDAFQAFFGGEVSVFVRPELLAATALLALVVLLFSAWIPARRTARVSAVEAIRLAKDVRLSRAALRRARRSEKRGAGRRRGQRAGAGRLFGVPGFIAHRNLSRSSSRGRTVVASIAVSVALLVTTGSLAAALSILTGPAAENLMTRGGADVTISARLASGGPFPAASSSQASRTAMADSLEKLDAFDAQARHIPEAALVSTNITGSTLGMVAADMVSADGRRAVEAFNEDRRVKDSPFGAQGAYYGGVTINFVDDDVWDGLAQRSAQRTEPDKAGVYALALNRYENSLKDGSQIEAAPFQKTGLVSFYAPHDDLFADQGRSRGSATLGEGSDGRPVLLDPADRSAGRQIPADQGAANMQVQVVGLIDEDADTSNVALSSFSFPTLVMPRSELPRLVAHKADEPNFVEEAAAELWFSAADHVHVSEELTDLAKTYPDLHMSTTDITEGLRQARLATQAVQLFLLCFSGIMMLVAVANVFNTLANSIILRTREFATLRSLGMGNRAFAGMLAYECASFALRGLAIGALAAGAVAFGLYRTISGAKVFGQIPIPWSWPYLGVAAAVVAAVLALSVAYALHRGHAASIVESLRADAL